METAPVYEAGGKGLGVLQTSRHRNWCKPHPLEVGWAQGIKFSLGRETCRREVCGTAAWRGVPCSSIHFLSDLTNPCHGWDAMAPRLFQEVGTGIRDPEGAMPAAGACPDGP